VSIHNIISLLQRRWRRLRLYCCALIGIHNIVTSATVARASSIVKTSESEVAECTTIPITRWIYKQCARTQRNTRMVRTMETDRNYTYNMECDCSPSYGRLEIWSRDTTKDGIPDDDSYIIIIMILSSCGFHSDCAGGEKVFPLVVLEVVRLRRYVVIGLHQYRFPLKLHITTQKYKTVYTRYCRYYTINCCYNSVQCLKKWKSLQILIIPTKSLR